MGTNHRGMPVGDNYRATPRLAQVMARRMTQDIRGGSPLSHMNSPEVHPSEAQAHLNTYREERDKYGKGTYHGVTDKEQQIYSALYMERNGY